MSEAYNDEHIAPKLAALAEECSANGLSFVSHAEWAPFEGQTTAKREAAGKISASHEMAYLAARANGNLDAFLFALARAHNEGKLDLSASVLALLMKLERFSAADKPSPLQTPDAGEGK